MMVYTYKAKVLWRPRSCGRAAAKPSGWQPEELRFDFETVSVRCEVGRTSRPGTTSRTGRPTCCSGACWSVSWAARSSRGTRRRRSKATRRRVRTTLSTGQSSEVTDRFEVASARSDHRTPGSYP